MDEQEIRGEANPGSGLPEGQESSSRDLGGNHEGDGNQELTPVSDERSPLHVKVAAYDGPLDLLLDLIKKNEMDIYNIPIAEITKQYLESLQLMKELDLEIAGEFIVMAATLIYIKSKMLLPQDPNEEEDEDGDPRAELVRKLLEYQAFKEAAKELGFLEGERSQIFTRQVTDYYLTNLDPEDVGMDAFSANLFDLLSAFQTALAKISKESLHEVFEPVITIEEKTAELRRRLLEHRRIRFTDLFGAVWTRNQLIVTFLAVLEVVRTRFARVLQENQFDEIIIEKRDSE